MSRTTRLRVLCPALHGHLTRDHAVMAVDVDMLHGAAAAVAAGAPLTSAQRAMITSTHHALGATGLLTATATMAAPAHAQLAAEIAALADTAAIQQRTRITTAVTATLKREGWLVTVVDGGEPDRYTGIEATRETEHLVAAAGAGELIADQAGAHDCSATVQALAASLQEAGLAVEVTDDVPHDGSGGSLYSLPGGPTRADAVKASLRRSSATSRQRHRDTARISTSVSRQGMG